MKKTVKYIITVAVIIAAAFLYAHVGKKVPVYDKTVDSSFYGNMGELTAGLTVQQEFICEKPVLSGVSIMCATYGMPLLPPINIKSWTGKTKEVLRSERWMPLRLRMGDITPLNLTSSGNAKAGSLFLHLLQKMQDLGMP